MNTRNPCRAREPQKCPHHGAAATVASLKAKVTAGENLTSQEVQQYMDASSVIAESFKKKESILATLLIAPRDIHSNRDVNSEATALSVAKKVSEIDNPEDLEYVARHCIKRLDKGNDEFDKRVGLALYQSPHSNHNVRHEVVWALGSQPLMHIAKKLKDPVLLDCLHDDLYSEDSDSHDGSTLFSQHLSLYLVSKTILENRNVAEGTEARIYKARPALKPKPTNE